MWRSSLPLVLIAVVAAAQLLLVLRLAGSLFDGALVIDISGLQRYRTETLAREIAAAHSGPVDAGWHARVDATKNAMLETSMWMRHSSYALDTINPPAVRPIRDDIGEYVVAVEGAERDPAADQPYRTIQRIRPRLVAEFDSAVKRRTALIDGRARTLAWAILAALVVQIATILAVWKHLVVPAERRRRTEFGQLEYDRARMLSFFDQNPDAIAVYDVRGVLVHANPARQALLGLPLDGAIGKHLTTFVSPAMRAGAARAFDAANAGETTRMPGSFEAQGGIAVDSTFFPYRIAGVHQGVIVVSKDMRALKAARAERDTQSRRIAALYGVVAAHGRNWERQLDDALAVACHHLAYRWGTVAEVSDERYSVLAACGDPAGIEIGRSHSLDGTLMRHVVDQIDVWEAPDLLDPACATTRFAREPSWRSIVAVRISADERLYGALVLASPHCKSEPLPKMDCDFVRVLAALLGSIIERGRQQKRLDGLAFFDDLTGLPNRVLAYEKIGELIEASLRRRQTFAVHFVDLDEFKAVNDTGGHAVGDEVLRLAAARLASCVRESDLVARLGGDEFVILQADAGDASDVRALDDRVIAAIERPFSVNGHAYGLSCSIGVSFYPDDGKDAMTLVARADSAMYRVKHRDDTVDSRRTGSAVSLRSVDGNMRSASS